MVGGFGGSGRGMREQVSMRPTHHFAKIWCAMMVYGYKLRRLPEKANRVFRQPSSSMA